MAMSTRQPPSAANRQADPDGQRPAASAAARHAASLALAARAGALLLLASHFGPAQAQAQPAAAPDGTALFAQHCATCHQPDGSGTVGLAPSLKGEHWAKLGADRSYLPRVLVHGLSGAIKVNGQTFVGSMPGFAALDDSTLAAVASHLRRLQGATEAGYTADEIRAARAQAGGPPQTRALRVQIVGP